MAALLRFEWTACSGTGGRLPPVYPVDITGICTHACGEHLIVKYAVVSIVGSSPRLWGTPKNTLRETVRNRFIPTPVGNTNQTDAIVVKTSVHPHACGEH
ncbi:hypothetical protein D1AOALGA4SA_11459 [Olavius algarvensis Delta 1 endosymbiont]|nr:hypothetical protein D1AOALGA4SA_11459 [Olavius algarvensis Delta 1 endosymbiont]